MFDYQNIIKNNCIFEQLKLQEQKMQSNERKVEANQDSNQENLLSFNLENKKENNRISKTDSNIYSKQKNNSLLFSTNSLSFSEADLSQAATMEDFLPKARKKKNKKRIS